MRVFIDFWKLETENNLLHVFSFLHKLSFENSFYFLPVLSCQTSFLVSKIEICFWKQKIRGKNSYQTYPNFWVVQDFLFEIWLYLFTNFIEPRGIVRCSKNFGHPRYPKKKKKECLSLQEHMALWFTWCIAIWKYKS